MSKSSTALTPQAQAADNNHGSAERKRMESLLFFLQNYTSIQMGIGVQTSRIIRNSTRIAKAYGYRLSLMMFQRSLTITLMPGDKLDEKNGYNLPPSRTVVGRHVSQSLNFRMNAELSALSWYIEAERPSIEEAEEKFEEIIAHKKLHPMVVLLLVGIANAAFCRLFAGDLMAVIFCFVATLCGFFCRQQLQLRHFNHLFVFCSASFVASFVAALLCKTGLSLTPEAAIGTSVLFLIPGVPLINSMLDLLDGYVLNGISRLLNAMMLIISLTIGVSVTILLFHLQII